MRVAATALFVLVALVARGQQVTITKVEVAGPQIIVTYDLDDSNPNHSYWLSLYSSSDNFTKALTRVTGDIGQEVKPGVSKKIIWNLQEEIGGYRGKLALEIRGRVYVPFVRVSGFGRGQKYKRGTSQAIRWEAGGSGTIDVELFKGDKRVAYDLGTANDGTTTIVIPANAKPGKDYTMRFTNTSNREETISTGTFSVVRKVPLGLKVLPLIAIGGAAAALGGGGGGGDNGGGNGEIPLPDFPQ